MTPAMIGLVLFLVMTALILYGVPICVAMLSVSFVGFITISGFDMAVTQFTNSLFTLSTSYSFAVVPLFMIVGVLAGATGIAAGAFEAAKKWLGRMRGGLLYTVVGANMVFGACSGISAAGDIVFSRIAMPELRKNGYDEKLSLGVITASGSLSCLIPPSIPIITFCLLTDVSIGQALVCGISAGILLAACLFITIKIISIVRPSKVPPKEEEKVPMVEKLKTLKLLLPIICLFALIVGGSFLGWFPATVGGAVATIVVIIYALFKRMSIKEIFLAVWDGICSFAGIYLIIVAGKFFSRFITLTGLASSLANTIAGMALPPFGVFCVILLFYIFCGCFLDLMSIIIITVPIIFPLLTALGYNPLVLVIVLVFSMEMATLTPPIGMAVFQVSNALRMSTSTIFAGVVPFFIVDLVITLLIALFPNLILWLPHLLGY